MTLCGCTPSGGSSPSAAWSARHSGWPIVRLLRMCCYRSRGCSSRGAGDLPRPRQTVEVAPGPHDCPPPRLERRCLPVCEHADVARHGRPRQQQGLLRHLSSSTGAHPLSLEQSRRAARRRLGLRHHGCCSCLPRLRQGSSVPRLRRLHSLAVRPRVLRHVLPVPPSCHGLQPAAEGKEQHTLIATTASPLGPSSPGSSLAGSAASSASLADLCLQLLGSGFESGCREFCRPHVCSSSQAGWQRGRSSWRGGRARGGLGAGSTSLDHDQAPAAQSSNAQDVCFCNHTCTQNVMKLSAALLLALSQRPHGDTCAAPSAERHPQGTQ